MEKTTRNAHLVTTELKRVFFHLKSVDNERSDLWKVLVSGEWEGETAAPRYEKFRANSVFRAMLQPSSKEDHKTFRTTPQEHW